MKKMLFRKKKKIKIRLGRIGIIIPTESSTLSGINDKFNKVIVIYNSVSIDGDTIRWGKKITEIPYTEAEAINLEKIKQIPIIEKKLSTKFKFKEGSPFGEVLN